MMILGHGGTSRSAAVRALTALRPPIAAREVRAEAPVHGLRTAIPRFPLEASGPDFVPVSFADFPLGATEDRPAGTLDIGPGLRPGVKVCEPRLLVRAHGGSAG